MSVSASRRQAIERGGGKVSSAHRPDLALESGRHRGHARWLVQIATESLGIAPHGAPAHARGHRTSIAVRGWDALGSATYFPA